MVVVRNAAVNTSCGDPVGSRFSRHMARNGTAEYLSRSCCSKIQTEPLHKHEKCLDTVKSKIKVDLVFGSLAALFGST